MGRAKIWRLCAWATLCAGPALALLLPTRVVPDTGRPPAAPGTRQTSNSSQVPTTTADTLYTYREPTSGGTGKVYMTREIATVMGHRGAYWLDRPGRTAEEAPDTLIRLLGLAPTDVVADIGAGSGYMTFRISPLVPDGMVLAVDIQKEMLDIIREKMPAAGADNVLPILGEITDPHLPEGGVDLALLVDTYHEFSHPYEMMTAIFRALRPGGRVVMVEARMEDPNVPIKRLHKMSEVQIRAEMEAVGLRWVETRDALPRQHFVVFARPDSTAGDNGASGN